MILLTCSSLQLCPKQFGTFLRRHHCRRCGYVFCATCCWRKLRLPELEYASEELVCNPCVQHKMDEAKLVPVNELLGDWTKRPVW